MVIRRMHGSYDRARERLVKQAPKAGLSVKQSYERVGRRLVMMSGRYLSWTTAGAVVSVTVKSPCDGRGAPPSKAFAGWSGDTNALANPISPMTISPILKDCVSIRASEPRPALDLKSPLYYLL